MTFNIGNFRANLNSKGYLRPYEYQVLLQPPPILGGRQLVNQNQQFNTNDLAGLVSLRATQARTPSAMMQWVEVPRYGIGLKQAAPYNAEIKDCSFSIICDKNGNLYNFFHSWLNNVFAFSPAVDAQGGWMFNQTRGNYVANYQDEYTTTVQINMFDTIGKKAIEFVLLKAWPITLQQIPLDWEITKNLVELTVIIDYRDFSVRTSNLGQGQVSTNLTSPPPSSIPSRTILSYI